MLNFYKANTYYEQQDYIMAIQYYTKSIHQSEGYNAQSYYNIATCNIKLNQYDLAIENLKTAIYFNNKNSDYYFNLGYSYAMINDNINALLNFKKARELNNNDMDCKKAICTILKANPDLSYLLEENNIINIKPKSFDFHKLEFDVKNNNNENIAININALTQQRRLLKQIDKALDDKDKEKFIRLTNRLHKINEKVLVKI